MGVEGHEAAVLQLPQGVDLGQGHVALREEPRQPGEDRRRPRQRATGHAGLGDHLLGAELGRLDEVREVPAADVVRMLLGHLLDVDPAHVAEEHHRLLADAVPDHARVVLLLQLRLRVHQHAPRHVPVDLELEDLLRVGGSLLRVVGELHAAGLHPAAGQHLGLDHGRASDALRDLAGLLGRAREPVVGHRYPGALHYLARLVFEESHLPVPTAAEPYREGTG